jgi:HK97 family phage prohead protease
MMNKEKREIRSSEIGTYNDATGIVEGYAATFDIESITLGTFKEIIQRGAITEDTIKASDVFAVIDHDRQRGILARSRNGVGSLKLEIDDKGLKYSFTLPDTQIGAELRSHLERGEITNSSFAFSVTADDWAFDTVTQLYTRHVKSIDYIYDISPVFNAAYEGTEVALRSLESIKQEIQNSLVKENRERAVRAARFARLKLNVR